MAKTTTLHELLIDELKDLYSAETQLTKALPKMAKAANDEALKAGFEEHLDQTHEHIARLDRVMELLEASPKGKVCKAMKGLVAEGEEKIDEDASPAVKDAALICAAQKVEHYEIASYGCARTFANLLGYTDAAARLQQTLDEEGAADKKLTELAETTINVEAENADDQIDQSFSLKLYQRFPYRDFAHMKFSGDFILFKRLTADQPALKDGRTQRIRDEIRRLFCPFDRS